MQIKEARKREISVTDTFPQKELTKNDKQHIASFISQQLNLSNCDTITERQFIVRP